MSDDEANEAMKLVTQRISTARLCDEDLIVTVGAGIAGKCTGSWHLAPHTVIVCDNPKHEWSGVLRTWVDAHPQQDGAR